MSAGCKAEQQLLHPGPTAGRGLQQGSDQAGMGWGGRVARIFCWILGSKINAGRKGQAIRQKAQIISKKKGINE